MAIKRAVKHDFLGAVTLLRFAPGGQLLYAGVGATVFVFDVASGELVGQQQVLSRGILHGSDCYRGNTSELGAFFGQKRVACFANLPVAAKAEDQDVWRPLGKPKTFSDWVLDVRIVLAEDSTPRIAVGLAHNFVQIWDPERNAIERTVQCAERCILYSLAFHGRRLDEVVVAAGTVFQQILLWNPMASSTVSDEVAPSQRLHSHEGVIFKLLWSEDARQLASVSDDRTVQLWTNSSGEEDIGSTTREVLLDNKFHPVFRAWGHTARLWDVHFCAGGLATTSEDGVCKLWNVDGECIATLQGHTGKHVWRVAVHPSQSLVATGGGDGAVKLWDVEQQVQSTGAPQFATISIDASVNSDISATNGKKKASITNSVRTIVANTIDNGATALVATEHGEIFLTTVATGEVTRFFSIPMESSTKNTTNSPDSLSTCSLSEGGRYLLVGDSVGHIFVVSSRTGELVYSWTARHRSRIMKIWWHESSVFASSADGTLTEWRPEFQSVTGAENKELVDMKLIASFHSPGKCSTTALVVLDRDAATRNIICGDGRGNVFVFHRSLEFDSEAQTAPTELTMPAVVLKAVHGREQVSTLLLNGTSLENDVTRLYSGGHDGQICTFLVEPWGELDNLTGAITIKPIARESIKGMTTVKELSWHKTSSSPSSRGDLLVLGFHSTQAILYNLSAQYRVFNVECGGWRRPHALVISPDSSQDGASSSLPSHMFLFAPPTQQKGDSTVQISVHSTSSSSANIQKLSLLDCYHGKMTTCSVLIDEDRLITAAEDNSLKLHRRQSFGASKRWASVSSGVAHTTTVRALTSFRRQVIDSNTQLGELETIIISGGGKQRVNVWRVSDRPQHANELQFVCGYEPRGALQDHRILGITTFALNWRYRLVVAGNSEGAMPLLLLDLVLDKLTELGECLLLSKKPILSCVGFQHERGEDGSVSTAVLAVGSTDGIISLFDLTGLVADLVANLPEPTSEAISRLQAMARDLPRAGSYLAHDMGVNCMALVKSDRPSEVFTLISGGDDQNLRLCEISLSTFQVEADVRTVNASGSAIKAIASVNDAVFIGGYDQRVSMWRVHRSRDQDKADGATMMALEWQCASFSECADIADLAVRHTEGNVDDQQPREMVVVVGQGLQTFEFEHAPQA